ncbi:hypothetical protein [Xanthomonas citri]|uniref:hypothetical protein n=1 Tax=Xanthomonas citri TaxID=346 RepID=UPI0011AFB1FF|nr:hypothetical protein [Xanthomonas citri]
MYAQKKEGKNALNFLRQSHEALLVSVDDLAVCSRALTGALLPAVEWLVENDVFSDYFCDDELIAALDGLFSPSRLTNLVQSDVLPRQINVELHQELSKVDGYYTFLALSSHSAAGGDALAAQAFVRALKNIEQRAGGVLIESHEHNLREEGEFSEMDGALVDLMTLAETDGAFEQRVQTAPGRLDRLAAGLHKGIARLRSFRVLRPAFAMLSWSARQVVEIRGEIRRAVRAPVRVRLMEGNALGLQVADSYGGGFVVVPMPAAGSADVLAVESGRHGFSHTVSIYRQSNRQMQVLRERAWSIDLADASTAKHVMDGIVSAYTRGRSGGKTGRRLAFATAAVIAVLATVGFFRTGQPSAPVAEAQAASPDLALNGLAAASFDPAGGLPPELMAQIMAGAQQAAGGVGAPGAGQGLSDSISAQSSDAFQSQMHAEGPPQVPVEDPSMVSFGLGRTIAGCDPSLKFKVAE